MEFKDLKLGEIENLSLNLLGDFSEKFINLGRIFLLQQDNELFVNHT